MAFLQQGLLQGHIIFDDTVVDDGKLAAFIRMGMGVDIAGFPVGSPAGMADAHRARRFMAYDFLPQGIQPAHAFFNIDLAIVVNGDAGRVIPSVFQFAQAFHQKRSCLMASDISYDSAHSCALLRFFVVTVCRGPFCMPPLPEGFVGQLTVCSLPRGIR